MSRFLFIILLVGSHFTCLEAQLISWGAEWKYYDLENEPSDQDSLTWRDIAFADSSWASGPAQLGYGDNDEATAINSDTYTAYFRKSITLNAAQLSTFLDLNLLYDDGAVVYINGTEIWRVNMPEGNIEYSTFASSGSGDDAMAATTITNLLVAGSNVITVELHQRSAGSSDLSFDLKVTTTIDPDQPQIVRGPYLQKGSNDRITIKWRTNLNSKSMVDFGGSINTLNNTVSDSELKTEHEVEITGLASDSIYFYQVRSDSLILTAPSTDLYFKTHPAIGTDHPITAWILGDCGTGNNNARAVRDAYYSYIDNNHTDMILFLGDNAYTDGTDTEYQTALFEDMYEEKLKNSISWSCLGNHDGHSANSSEQSGPYYDIFSFPIAAESGGTSSGTEAYYSFDFGNAHFIVLDSYDSDRSIGGPMYNWCLNDIQNTTANWIIAFWHHPAYTKGSHDSDSESALIQMRERFLPILEDNGVDLILSGHSHSYERSHYLNGHYGDSDSFVSSTHTIGTSGSGNGQIMGSGAYRKPISGPDQGDGTVYITTGSAGKTSAGLLDHEAMFYSVSSLGSCIMNINQDTLSMRFLRNTGVVEDSFYIIKCRGTEVVMNSQNDGPGSLRQTIIDACPCDTITFANSISNPITLLSEISLDKQLTFYGNDTITILDGNTTNRIFNIQDNILTDIKDLQFQNTNAMPNGGSILNHGILYLENVIFENNYEGAVKRAFTNNGEVIIRSNSGVIIRQ